MGRKWLPMADIARQDIWSDISNAIATPNDTYRNAPGFLASGTAAAGVGTTVSAWQGTQLTGAAANVAGVNGVGAGVGKLYTWAGTVFTDRSIAGDYTDNAAYWSFAQYGVYTLATNGLNQIQVRDATGVAAFANLAGTPPTTAKYIVTQSGAVLVFNTNSGTQYWAASDVGNHTNWTTGESASGPINHRPGPITAAVALRDEVIVFKENSSYRMRYVGGLVKWTVELLSDVCGALGPGSVVSTGDVVAVCDYKNGAYLFDGAAIRRIDDGFKAYLIQIVGSPVAAQYFRSQESLWWNIPTSAVLQYNLKYQAWGKFTAQCPTSQAVTPNHVLMTGTGIYDELRGATFINVHTASAPILSSFAEDEAAGTNNTALTGYVTTGLFGSHGVSTEASRIIPHLKIPSSIVGTTNVPAATAMTLTPYTQSNPEGTASAGSPVACSTIAEKRFDYLKAAGWQKFKITFTSTPWEIEDVLATTRSAGVSL